MSKNNSKKVIKFVDLFCGIGGFRLAGESQGWKCVMSCDNDPFAQKTYEANFGHKPHGDIYEIKSSSVEDFDVLFAGFPCQSFSYSGKGMGFDDKRGVLFYEVLRFLEDKKPKAFLLENVKGLVSHDSGRTLTVIEKELKLAGYHIEWRVLNSADFGVPQNRERWYCVGFKEKLDFTFPESLGKKVVLKDILEKNLKDDSLKLSPIWEKRLDRHFKSKLERVPHNDFDKNSNRGKHGVFSFLKPDETLRFHMGDVKKTQIQEGFFTSSNSIAPTIIANRVPQLWDLRRKLSLKECIKLQGFPNNFKFPCSAAQSYKQLGNSITVPVVQKLVEQINLALQGSSKTTKRQLERAA
jgi:DNA (cytosine-5)-methyltransferase 1